MSWVAASLVLVVSCLAAGFVWYEHTRPDAKMIALVGVLAAFAALGRIAFAALPNVKPTSDIVLLAGFALGGAPGYVVGAITGLASNFFFGQGPWTPWQMFAWGMTGLAGAGLARLTARRLGRWGLSVACFIAAFAFTAFQDFSTWMMYSNHRLATLLATVGSGVGFDLVYGISSFAFAVIFGPVFIRALERYRRRLEIRWHRLPAGAAGTALTVLAVAVAVGTSGRPPSAQAASVGSPLAYLRAAQNTDGGFPSAPGQASSAMVTDWSVIALAASGERPASMHAAGVSAGSYLVATIGQDLGDASSLERTILAAQATGCNPRSVDGQDLVVLLAKKIGANGSIGDQTNLTAFAVLALRSAGAPVATRTIRWLLDQQDADGGFNFATGGAVSDVDDSGAVLEALAARPLAGGAGVSGLKASGEWPAVARAVRFIESAQNRDGGFPSESGGTSNAQSTAWGVQGLDAVAIRVATLHRRGGATPLAYLRSLIGASGAVDYASGQSLTPVWVTAEALTALDGRPLPLSAPRLPAIVAARPTTSATQTTSATGTATTSTIATATASPTTAAKRGANGGRRVPRRSRPVPAQAGAGTGHAAAEQILREARSEISTLASAFTGLL